MIERYNSLKHLWSDKKKYSTWLDVEIAVCGQLSLSGKIPKDMCKIFKTRPSFDKKDLAAIEKIERSCKHDVIAFLTFLESFYGTDAKYIHYGLTSSDIVDTSLSLLYRQALIEISEEVVGVCERMDKLIAKHKRTIMMGRTHGMHAQPITFSIFLSSHLEQFKRCVSEIDRAIETISYGKLSGAVGTNINITVEEELLILNSIGLKSESFATQVVCRDRHAMCVATLALLASAIERFALNIRHLQREEIGELQECFTAGQKGSSAMPHKKNPILSENLCGLSRLVRGMLAPSFENISLWHERDISHSSVERVIIPDITSLSLFMTKRVGSLLSGLQVNEDKMLENFNKSSDKAFTELLLLKLLEHDFTRQEAYTIIQECAHQENNLSLKDRLIQSSKLSSIAGLNIEEIFNVNYVLNLLERKINDQ